MPLTDELVLETRRAFAELDALQGRLDRISDVRLDVNIDTSSLNADLERSQRLVSETADGFREIQGQVTLTTDEYRTAVRLIQDGEDATRAVATVTGQIADEAGTAEDAFRRVAAALDLSEDDARQLASAVGRSTQEAGELEGDLRRVARSMGLSEDEAADFSREMQRASDEARTLDRRTDDISRGWGRLRTVIAGAVAAIGVRGLARGFGSAIDAASELEQSIGGIRAIFGEAADDVLLVGEAADESVGLAENAFNQLAARLGGQLQTFGFDAQGAARETQNLIELGADLAATYGGPVSSAVEAISSLLRGEIDPIERYAVSINQAAINAEALRLGLVDSTSEIDIQTRAMAALSLLNEQTAQAQGQFGREAETTAGQLERLRARAGNLQTELGEALIPRFNEILEVAPRFVIDVRAMGESLREMAGDAEAAEGPLITLGDTIAGLPRGFGVLGDVVSGVGGAVGNAATAFANLFAGPLTGRGFGPLVEDFEQGTDAIQGMIDSLQQRAILESFIDALKEGEDPAVALANAAAATARNNELTVESFESLARISGVTDDRLRDVAATLIEAGEAAGISAEEAEGLQEILDEFAIGQQVDRDVAGLLRLGRAAREIQEPIERSAEGVQNFNQRVQEIRVDQITDELGDIQGTFDALPDGLEAAAAALRTEENEIVEDFGDFVGNLETEIEARSAFRENIALLRAMGLDDLATVFSEEGLDAAAALADAVANPEEARRAEALLDAEAETIATSFRQTLIDGITSQGLDLTIPADVAIAINSLVAQGLTRADAQATAGREVRREVGGVGGAGADVNITNNFNTTPQPTTDTQRVSQSVSNVIRNLVE